MEVTSLNRKGKEPSLEESSLLEGMPQEKNLTESESADPMVEETVITLVGMVVTAMAMVDSVAEVEVKMMEEEMEDHLLTTLQKTSLSC